MALDSQAVFFDRMSELGLSPLTEIFKSFGWNNTGNFAFATSYTPGGDTSLLEEEIFKPLFSDPTGKPDLKALKPAVRRLFTECSIFAAADMKRKVEGTSEDAPRKVPALEREERREKLKSRLIGTKMTNELDPSDRLIDKTIEIYEQNRLRYL